MLLTWFAAVCSHKTNGQLTLYTHKTYMTHVIYFPFILVFTFFTIFFPLEGTSMKSLRVSPYTALPNNNYCNIHVPNGLNTSYIFRRTYIQFVLLIRIIKS